MHLASDRRSIASTVATLPLPAAWLAVPTAARAAPTFGKATASPVVTQGLNCRDCIGNVGYHSGTDIDGNGNATDEAVVAVGAGVVRQRATASGYGNTAPAACSSAREDAGR